MASIKTISVETTKRGYPALWECGGGYSNTGNATLIGDSNGAPKKALYVRGRGPLACDNHALFIVHSGDMVVKANHHNGDFNINVFRLGEYLGNGNMEVTDSWEYSRGEWDKDLPEDMWSNDIHLDDEVISNSIITSAMRKAKWYHCREMVFGGKPDKKIA